MTETLTTPHQTETLPPGAQQPTPIAELLADLQRHYESAESTVSTTPVSTETKPSKGADASTDSKLTRQVYPADPAEAIAEAGTYEMWQPVVQRPQLPKAGRGKWQAAKDSKDPWVRSLNPSQIAALDSTTRRYYRLPEPIALELPPVVETVSAPAAGEPAETTGSQVSKDAAIASLAEQYAHKRADVAMEPELDDDLAVELAHLEPDMRRNIEKAIYRQQKRDRERAAETPEQYAARVTAEAPKARRAARWLGQGLVRASVAMGGGQAVK